jgi:hypothetical protein
VVVEVNLPPLLFDLSRMIGQAGIFDLLAIDAIGFKTYFLVKKEN